MNIYLKKNGIAAALALIPFVFNAPACFAAQPDPTPGAGQLLRELPQPLLPDSAKPTVHVETPGQSSLDDSHNFRVERIDVTGNTLIDADTLHALIADAEHSDLTLRKASALADRITELYRSRGYPLARAIIPAQTLAGGDLKIAVIEGHYGRINLDNQSLVTKGGVLASTLAAIQSAQVVSQDSLDRTILLLSDTPGVVVNATLAPGAEVGTTDLNVATTSSERVTGSGVLDNDGNRYTGRARLSANLAVASPLGFGDQFTANILTSGSGLNDAAVGYSLPLIDASNRVGVDYSSLDYRLENGLDAIDAHGTASVADVWAAHAFVRSTDVNLTGRIEYAHKQLNDTVGVSDLHTDRHTDAIAATLSMDRSDQFWGGGVTNVSLTGTAGSLGFDSAGSAATDAKTARTAGQYAKLDLTFSRLQTINEDTSLYASFVSQFANSNLDSSEQLIAGGEASVRGYDVGALSGDEGDFLTLELRRRLSLPLSGVWQAKGFFDTGYIKVNQQPWAAGQNSAHLNSIGFGLDWYGPAQWTGKLDVARSIGSTPSLLGNVSLPVRAWFSLSKTF